MTRTIKFTDEQLDTVESLRWILQQQKQYSEGTLSQEKINKLETIEWWSWDYLPPGPVLKVLVSF